MAQLRHADAIVVLASFITPIEADRQHIRSIVGGDRTLIVYLSTPLEICESRDPHGLYKKSRAGVIREFTGISSPFEVPQTTDLVINTSEMTLEESVAKASELLLSRIR